MIYYSKAFGVILSLSISATAFADMIDDSSLEPWETCALCHGLYGDSVRSKFPKLAGQKVGYLSTQIKYFQTGNRTNDGGQMQSMVESLSNDDIKQIANWFSAQPAPKASREKPSQADIDDLTAVLGDAPKQTCGTCHRAASDDPQTTLPAATLQVPFLHAQHADYLAKQMTDFKTGDRSSASLHQPLLKDMSPAKIEILAQYYASQARANN